MITAGRRFLEASRERVDRALDAALPGASEAPALLHEAMRYAVLSGGKRLRPALAFASARACGVAEDRVLPVAVAVELVHAYSLVHDDLPAMDDDSERRGKPTVHVKFGEDIAILAGDALLPLAFSVLGHAGAPGAVVARLADAAGSRHLVGGQVDDLRLDWATLTREQLTSIHERKTGALFRFAVCGAAELAGAQPDTAGRLERFARAYSAAFQIADDLADGERSEASILRVVSTDEARRMGSARAEEAGRELDAIGTGADALAALVAVISQRLGSL
jgi:geranylgeranyl pyrophosphate synthase